MGHQNSGAPPFFGAFFLYYEPVCAGNALIKLGNMGDSKRHLEKKEKIKFLMLVLEILTKTVGILEEAPEFWCLGSGHQNF